MAQHRVTGQLKPVPPFDFTKSLEFLGIFSPTMGEQTLEEQSLTKAISSGGQVAAFTVRSVGSVKDPLLEYKLVSDEPIGDDLQQKAADRIGFYLSINDDLIPFYTIARQDAAFAPVLQRLYGYHQVKFLTPFENAAWAIVSQRNPMAVARKVKVKLTERYGGSIIIDGLTYRAFPEAGVLASVPPDELIEIVKHEKKAEYLRSAAEAFARADEQFLRTGKYEDVEAWLLGIKGIGPWSATFIMLRGLGRMERIPLSEGRLEGVAAAMYNEGRPLSPAELEKLASRYGAEAGHWVHYLRVGG
ncbi:MAG: DNA-3-methyladenine glycosylase 2 family protein [Chloroflexota bacterium]